MRSTKSHFALAAVLAALSTPALADDASLCSVCGDPTWPELDNPAPALTLRSQGGEVEALVGADPTWPAETAALPGIAVVAQPADGGEVEPARVDERPAAVDYAAVLGAPVRQVAKK